MRCPKCREEFLVAYSCRVRCFCPSCHEKRALEKAGWVAEHVCAEVPHRQFVFTIPKRLRIYFRFERRLLGDLCRAAARTVITVYQSASGRPDAVPGMVGAIQTFGQLTHAHPPIHALVTEGVFLPETGAFLPLPKLASESFLRLWEQEVFALLLREGKISQEVVQNIRSWRHSGFSVDQSVRLEAGDQTGGLKVGLCLPEARIGPFRAVPAAFGTSPGVKILPVGASAVPHGQNLHSHPVFDHDFPWSERRWRATLSAAQKSKFLLVILH